MGKTTKPRSDDQGRGGSDPAHLGPPALWKHQRESLRFFSTITDGNDFSSPGTAKTRVQLEDFKARGSGRLLVVCPKTLMQSAWGNDIDTFTPELTYSLAKAGQREDAFKLKTDVVIINADGVKDLVKNKKWLDGFTRAVVDESTYFKTPNSQRTKALISLRKHFKVRRNMTGTPNPNTVMEMWAPQMWLDGGTRLGTSYYKLRSLLCHPEQNGPLPEHVKWVDNPAAQQQIMALLSDCTIRHEFDKVMTHVPANYQHVKRFTLSRKAQAIYERFVEDAVVMIKESAITAVNAAVLRTRALQICSGAVYSSEGKYELVDTGRYELITEIIEPTDHSIVFFNWKHQRDELAKQFTNAGYKFAILDGSTNDRQRQDIVADYQKGKYKTLLMHPRTGAHGLTLTRGTLTVFSSPVYESDLFAQAKARIYRGSQNQVTNTIMVQADNTVEGAVYERLNDKTQRMEDLLMLAAERKS